jgi:quinol monooxygenase YgiN
MIRVVKMSFHSENVDKFLAIFNENKKKIRAFDGCQHLELWRDIQNEHVFFTYSHWEHSSNLEQYRNSALFKDVWNKTKILFNDKPQAWSVEQNDVVF